MRTQKSAKNLIFGIGLQLITSIIGLVNRTVFIKTIGLEALSLNGLFTEVLTMLSLAELGIGAAITYSLYKPLAENDQDQISRLVNLFSKAYKIVAAIVFGVGIILIPVIHLIIKDISYPLNYIRLVYFLFVVQTASSYLFSYLGALITADQKRYVVSIVSIVTKIVMTVFQIIVLVLTNNFILYLVCSVLFTLINNIALSVIAKKLYPFLNKNIVLGKEESKEIFSNIKNIFISRISGTITNSTDNTLISVLVGTIYVGLYSNYAVFLGIVKGIINQFSNAVMASFGNLLVTESADKSDVVLRRATYIMFVFGAICCTGLFCVLTPVIELWIGKEYLLDDITLFVSIMCLFINVIRTPLWTILDASGLFKENSYTGIVGSIINLIVSIVLGLVWGVPGIFIGTICTYVVQGVMKIHYLYNRKLSCSTKFISTELVIYNIVFFVQCLLAKFICSCFVSTNIVLNLVVYGCIAVVISLLFDLLFFIRTDSYHYCISTVKSLLKIRRLHETKIK